MGRKKNSAQKGGTQKQSSPAQPRREGGPSAGGAGRSVNKTPPTKTVAPRTSSPAAAPSTTLVDNGNASSATPEHNTVVHAGQIGNSYGWDALSSTAHVPPQPRRAGDGSAVQTEPASATTPASSVPELSFHGVGHATDAEVNPTNPALDPSEYPDALSYFRAFVTMERQKLARKKQELAKNEQDKTLKDLVEFSNAFKLNKPIPSDLIPILAKDSYKQKAIFEKSIQDSHDNKARSIEPTFLNASRLYDVKEIPPFKDGPKPAKRPARTLEKSAIRSSAIEEIPPFKGGSKVAQESAGTPGPNATPIAPFDSSKDKNAKEASNAIAPGVNDTAAEVSRVQGYDTETHRRALSDALDSWKERRIPREELVSSDTDLGEGGFGIVVMGTWIKKGESKPLKVAIKKLRRKRHTFPRLALRFARELTVWLTLDHPNILPCLGFNIDMERREAYFVSPCLSRGNIYDRLSNDSTVTIGQRMKWVVDVTKGLNYLHSLTPPAIHGDLKSENILLDDAGSALLCDFGQSSLMEESGVTGLTTSDGFKGSVRWCSPELVDGEKRTTRSDMWAWALCVLEILTGRLPFETARNDAALILRIAEGRYPTREEYPEVSQDSLMWETLEDCFQKDPTVRPSIHDCLIRIVDIG